MANDTGQPTPEQLEAIHQALRDGRKIEAIKLYLEATGTDLASAKDAVEAMQARMSTAGPVEGPPRPIKPPGCAVVLAALLSAVATVASAVL